MMNIDYSQDRLKDIIKVLQNADVLWELQAHAPVKEEVTTRIHNLLEEAHRAFEVLYIQIGEEPFDG